ncbi:MAG: CBS domain-containing protein [Acidobacteriota bacterium]
MPEIHELIRRPEVHSVQKERLVLDVVQFMTQMNVGAVSVLEGENLVGIFSERDLMTRVVNKELSPADTPVEQVMTPDPVVVDAQTSVEDCMRVMSQAKCRHLPIVSAGKMVGMVSLRDLLLYNISQKDDEIQLMRAFIHYVPPSTPTDQES